MQPARGAGGKIRSIAMIEQNTGLSSLFSKGGETAVRVATLMTAVALLAGCIISPASAGEKYLYGEPKLSAAIAGSNEFEPGDERQVTVMIENTGLNTVKIVQPGIINGDVLPNTAKLTSAALGPGNAPVRVKTDPQMIGDIAGGATAPASFVLKVDRDAEPGTYALPLQVTYTRLYATDQYGGDLTTYSWAEKTETIPLEIRVKEIVTIAVSDVRVDSLNVGTEGFVYLKVRNNGFETARAAVLKIARSGMSPVIPTDDSVFIGDLRPGEEVAATFKASVSKGAEAQTYPLTVLLEYEDSDRQTATADGVTIGIPVGGKIDFAVVASPAPLAPGEKAVLEVTFKNTGSATAHSAQARISAVDPFTSDDDTAYLGEIAPGESKVARFTVSVDAGATEKIYGLDAEVRYRDALDNTQISDTMKVDVDVRQTGGSLPVLPALLGLTLMGCIGYGAWTFRLRRRP